jgi:hypothetical protein
VPTADGTRIQRLRPATPGGPSSRISGTKPSSTAASGAVDHWSAILFYSLGFGTVAVGILLFAVLLLVSLYGQFVWTFTQWDGTNIRLSPFKSLAYLIVTGTFVGGVCVGLWCFSGAAWKKQQSSRASRTRR